MEIRIQNLRKKYRNGHEALKGVDLTIKDGMFGLLGPNGAGKSTFMKILVTLLEPSEGGIYINGKDHSKNRTDVRKMIGYLPQDFRFFAKLKTGEFLEYAGQLAGIKSRKQRKMIVDELLEKVGLSHVKNRYANKLSGGMKRRLGIAQSLIGDPKLLIVDEPTTGLDPEERIRFRNVLSDISHKEIIIILSTHIVGDISSTCNQMALLDKGSVAFTGSPDQLIKEAQGNVWQMTLSQDEYLQIKDKVPIISTIPSHGGWEVIVVGDVDGDYQRTEVIPNLEHAYVHFMENKLNSWMNDSTY